MENDDLFAGLIVKGRQVAPADIPKPVKSQQQSTEYDDLFRGLSVGGKVVESEIDRQARRGKLSREMEHPTQPRTRETRAVRELPEIGSGGLLHGEDRSKIAMISPVLLSTTDPKEIAQILTSQFPNIGIQEDEAGNLIAGNMRTGTKVVINKPGISKLDVLQGLGIMAAFTPAARLATIGTEGMKVGVGMAARRMAQGAAASAGTEAALQLGQAATGGEFDTGDVALAGGLGGLSEMVPVAFQGFRQGRKAAQLGVKADELADVLPSVKRAQASQSGIKEVTGVKPRLFPGQQTSVPAQLEEQSFVGMLPAGTRKARKELLLQNREAGQVVDSLLNKIAPAKALETGAAKTRLASQKRLEALKTARTENTDKIYKAAFKEADKNQIVIGTSDIQRNIDDVLKNAPEGGSLQKTLTKSKEILSSYTESRSNLKKLQNAKFELDNMLEGPASTSLDSTVKLQVQNIKKQLVDKMTKASPLYEKADKAYEQLSKPIDEFAGSLVGKISKIDDTQLKNVSKRLFDPTETNPALILKSKKVIESVDPEAWREITRVEMERRLGSMKGDFKAAAEGATASIENLPGQLERAIFGNARQRAVLYAGVDSATKKNLKYLEEYLGRAKLGRPGGSQTATREEIKKRLSGGIITPIRNFLQSPIKTVTGVGDEALFDRKTRALADALFDPKWQPKLEKIRQLKADTPDAARAMAQLLDDVWSGYQAEKE